MWRLVRRTVRRAADPGGALGHRQSRDLPQFLPQPPVDPVVGARRPIAAIGEKFAVECEFLAKEKRVVRLQNHARDRALRHGGGVEQAMSVHTFSCLDGHTCGNPVRLVSGGAPLLEGATMSERRLDFLANHDWIRKALMFEPRGHDVMSGSMLYPPTRADCDVGILFIEVSGCLPMCGHGTIGTVTMAVENGLVSAGDAGRAQYRRAGRPRGGALRAAGPLRRERAHHQRRLLSGRERRRDRRAGHGRAGVRHRLWRQLLRDPRAAEELRGPRSRCRRATCCGCRRSCAGC